MFSTLLFSHGYWTHYMFTRTIFGLLLYWSCFLQSHQRIKFYIYCWLNSTYQELFKRIRLAINVKDNEKVSPTSVPIYVMEVYHIGHFAILVQYFSIIKPEVYKFTRFSLTTRGSSNLYKILDLNLIVVVIKRNGIYKRQVKHRLNESPLN